MAHPLEKHVGKLEEEKEKEIGGAERSEAKDMLREPQARIQGPDFFYGRKICITSCRDSSRSSEKNNKNSFLSFVCPLFFEALAQVMFRSIYSAVTFCSIFNDKM